MAYYKYYLFYVVSWCNLRNYKSLNHIKSLSIPKLIERPLFSDVCNEKRRVFRTLPKIIKGQIVNYSPEKKLHGNCVTGSKSSQRRCSMKKAVLKNFAIFKGKHLSWNLFLINFQAWRSVILLKRDCISVVFLWILQHFWEHLFWGTSAGRCFWGSLNPLHVSSYNPWKHKKMRALDIFSGCTKRTMAQNG